MQIRTFYFDTQRLSYVASMVLAGLAMWAVLNFHLLSALLAGLAVHQLTIKGAARLHMLKGGRARGILVATLSVVIIALLVGAGLGIHAFFHSQAGDMGGLVDKINQGLISGKANAPDWLASLIPANMDALKIQAFSKMQTHALEIQGAGKAALTNFAHILVGLILGAMVALSEISRNVDEKPLAKALRDRVSNLSLVFGKIVSAQLKISLFNTTLTTLFLFAVLPLLGTHLPLSKTLVALTFIVGLLPVVGNLISNSLIVIISLSVAPWVAGVSLGFLVLIHKLEYFLNAKIVGGEIKAKSWEILLAMLVMEAIFGLPGVIAAPIFYAWLKRELVEKGLI